MNVGFKILLVFLSYIMRFLLFFSPSESDLFKITIGYEEKEFGYSYKHLIVNYYSSSIIHSYLFFNHL